MNPSESLNPARLEQETFTAQGHRVFRQIWIGQRGIQIGNGRVRRKQPGAVFDFRHIIRILARAYLQGPACVERPFAESVLECHGLLIRKRVRCDGREGHRQQCSSQKQVNHGLLFCFTPTAMRFAVSTAHSPAV